MHTVAPAVLDARCTDGRSLECGSIWSREVEIHRPQLAGGAAPRRIDWLLPDAEVEALAGLAEALQRSRHGAMLIISGHAAQ